MGGTVLNRLIGHIGWPPYAIHRLDMNTSGVLLFVKRRELVPDIHRQFRERQVVKEYVAVVAGVPAFDEFSIEEPIGQHPLLDVGRQARPDGRQALTRFRVLAACPSTDLSAGQPGQLAHVASLTGVRGASLVACRPLTGRTHQIRVHLQCAGHPILGDELYGLEVPWISRQALHAHRLQIAHPETKKETLFEAPLSEDIHALLASVGLSRALRS